NVEHAAAPRQPQPRSSVLPGGPPPREALAHRPHRLVLVRRRGHERDAAKGNVQRGNLRPGHDPQHWIRGRLLSCSRWGPDGTFPALTHRTHDGLRFGLATRTAVFRAAHARALMLVLLPALSACGGSDEAAPCNPAPLASSMPPPAPVITVL